MLKPPLQVKVMGHNNGDFFRVSSLRSWTRAKLQKLSARDSWQDPPANWNEVSISFLNLLPPDGLAGATERHVPDVTGQVCLATSSSFTRTLIAC